MRRIALMCFFTRMNPSTFFYAKHNHLRDIYEFENIIYSVILKYLQYILHMLRKIQKQSSRKSVLKIYSKFTAEHPCQSVISIKLQSSFIDITLWHDCSPVYLLHFFRTAFPKNTSGCMLLKILPRGAFKTQSNI